MHLHNIHIQSEVYSIWFALLNVFNIFLACLGEISEKSSSILMISSSLIQFLYVELKERVEVALSDMV